MEDNPGDVRLLRVAFAQVAFPREPAVATDGVEAMAYLRRKGEFAGAADQ